MCKCSDNLFQTNVYIKCNLDRSHTHTHAHIRTTRNMAWGCVGWQEHDLQVRETSGWAIIRTICVFPQVQPSSIATARHEWPASNRFRTSTRCCSVRIVHLLAIVTTLPNQNISPVWRVVVESLTYKTSLRLVEVSVSRDFLTQHILLLIIADTRKHNNYFKTHSSAI